MRDTKILFLYYFLIGLFTIFFACSGKELGSIGRVIYCSAIILPSIANIKLLSGALVCFWGISMCIFTPLFPSTTSIILLEIIVAIVISPRHLDLRVHKFFFIICVSYFCLNDVLHASLNYVYNLELGIFVAILLSFCISKRKDVEMLALGFCFMSIFISVIFLLTYKQFLHEYALNGIERSSWINPNYLGGHLSLGIVSGLWLMFYGYSLVRKKIYRLIIILGLLICIVALGMNASRGSILACSLPFLWFLWTSRIQKKTKIGVILLNICFIIFLLSSNYIELLIYRFGSDDATTGNGRTIIWVSKINEFLSSDNLMNLLFGIGQDACREIAVNIATHNDFVTSFIAYGFIGIVLFILFIALPIIISNKQNRKQIIGLSLFLCIECFVLEPIYRGYYVFIIYYLFIYKLSQIDKYSNSY